MKTEKRFWVVVALVFVAILVWHITSAIIPPVIIPVTPKIAAIDIRAILPPHAKRFSTMPPKPKNASEIKEAAISVAGRPLKLSGISLS